MAGRKKSCVDEYKEIENERNYDIGYTITSLRVPKLHVFRGSFFLHGVHNILTQYEAAIKIHGLIETC
jgi:hypothetical protein